jgi:hypothetical protein
MKEKRYLKNAWAKKDADGSYWLLIEGNGLQFKVTDKIKRALP